MSGLALFIIAAIAFVVWHFLPERQPSKPTPKLRREPRAVASDPNWSTFIDEHCESPAESAFLRAIISSHNLLPENGSLKAGGLKIDFQVEVAQYRLDFLANDRLIIEVDGAKWHSSDEAKARDAARDSFFIGLGYSVVRIPAKVVFDDPDDAVRRVTAALKAGKSIPTEPAQRSGLERLRQTASSTSKFISGVNAEVDHRRRLTQALSAAELAHHTEKQVLGSVVDAAERQVRIDEELGGNVGKRASYNAAMESLTKAFEEADRRDQKRASNQTITVPPYLRPELSGIAEVDQQIKERFASMSAEREAYFHSVRAKLRNDQRLAPLVRAHLNDFGCPQVWEHIA